MKKLWLSLINSIKLPQKRAVFTLNRIGMDITVFYLFVFLAVASLPALLAQMSAGKISGLYVHTLFVLIYFFIFYYLVIVVIVFSLLSIIAYIALLISRALKRKLHYSILWKMSAFASTIPLILFTVLSFFMELSYGFLALMIIFTLIILVRIILIYPARKGL